jgi:hypothetical protein
MVKIREVRKVVKILINESLNLNEQKTKELKIFEGINKYYLFT